MKNKLTDLVEEKVQEKISNLGFEIEYIEYVKEGDNNILRIVLDKLNGVVNIDDCENVSRSIEDDIDSIVKDEYVLEVSSPGLERQLKNIKLYKKYIGEQIFVKLFKKNEIGKEFEGKLEDIDEENEIVIVNVDNKKISIFLDNISSAHTVFDFKDTFSNKDKTNLNKLSKF